MSEREERDTKGEIEPLITDDATERWKAVAMRATGLSPEAFEKMLAASKAHDRYTSSERARDETDQRERAFKRMAARVRELEIPIPGDLFEDVVRRKYTRTRATEALGSWLRSRRRILGLLGPPGTGKTVAAALAAVLFVGDRKSVAYVREHDLLKLVHSTTLAAEERLNDLCAVDLLIIDECGQTLEADADRARIATGIVLDRRIGGSRRTLFIGNLTIVEVVARYGTRVADRMREVGELVELKLEAGEKSLRRLKPQGAITEAASAARKALLVAGVEDV